MTLEIVRAPCKLKHDDANMSDRYRCLSQKRLETDKTERGATNLVTFLGVGPDIIQTDTWNYVYKCASEQTSCGEVN